MAAGINLGALVYDLMLKKGTWEQDIDRAKMDVRSVEKAFSETGASISKAGSALTMGVTLPILGAAAAIGKVGIDFDSSMSRVKAISQATEAEFDSLRKKALQLGRDTAFSSNQSAQAMENLAAAGFATNEIIASMDGLLDLAASSGTDLGVAAQITSSILRGFNMAASDSGHIADVLALASSKTNAQVESMGDAMKYVAPIASAMGISLEETAAAIGILSNAGIMGSQAGTTLRASLARLTKPTEQMQTVMNDLGLAFYDADGKMKSIQELVIQLSGSFEGLTEQQQQSAITTLFGQEAMSGMLALIAAGPDQLADLTNALIESDGAAKGMAETMLDNLGGSFTILGGSLEAAGISIFDMVKGPVKEGIDRIIELVNAFTNLDEETKKQILSVAGAAAAMGPLLLGVGKITSGMGGLVPIFAQVKGGLGGLVSGLTGTASGLLSNISHTTGLSKVFDGIKGKVGTATGPLQKFIGNFAPLQKLLGPLNSGFGMFGKIVGGLFGAGGIVAIALTLLTTLAAGASAAGVDVESMISNVVDGVTKFATNFAEKFRELAPKVLEAMPKMLMSITDGIISMLDVLLPIGLEMIIMLIQGLAQNMPAIITSAIDIVLNVVDALLDAAPLLIEAAFALIIGIVTGLIDNADRVIDAAIRIMQVLITSLVDNLPIIIEKLPEIIIKIVDALIEATPMLLEAGWQLTVGIATGLIQAIPKLLEAVGALGSKLLDRIKGFFGIRSPSTVFAGVGTDLIQGLINGIVNMITNVGNAIGNIAGRISEGISGVVDSAKEWGGNLIGRLSEGISNAKNIVSNAVSGISSAISGGVTGVLDKAKTWGSDMMNGLAGGINSAKDTVANAAKSVASRISNFLHFTRPDEGPLREYEEWMPHMIDGMSKGIDRNMQTVVGAARRMSQEMSDAIMPTVSVGFAADMQAPVSMPGDRRRTVGSSGSDGLGDDNTRKLSEAVKRGVSEAMKDAGNRQDEVVVNVYEDGLLKRTIREGRRANQRAGKPVLQMG